MLRVGNYIRKCSKLKLSKLDIYITFYKQRFYLSIMTIKNLQEYKNVNIMQKKMIVYIQ
jgi:ArsR family metal-binding transcriptional regulator